MLASLFVGGRDGVHKEKVQSQTKGMGISRQLNKKGRCGRQASCLPGTADCMLLR